MIVIIEGPDGTGKTTLAKQLTERGMIYHYRQRYNNYTTDEMTQMMYDDKIHILDRSFLTTWVYRVTQNEPLDECDFSFEQTIDYMKSGKLKIVYCNYPYGFDAAIERGEDIITSYDIWNKLKRGYDFVANTIELFNLCPIYWYLWTMDTIDNVIKFIKEENDAV